MQLSLTSMRTHVPSGTAVLLKSKTNASFEYKRTLKRNMRLNVVSESNEEAPVGEAKKIDANELRSKFSTPESIDEEVERLRRELFKMRIKFAKREEYKPAQKKALRKQVAQLLTIKREREIESGVDRRTAKNAEKRRLVEAGLGRF